MAVNGFFAISGFLIMTSWLRSGSVRDYLTKRILRIYPGYLVHCLFCALIIGPLAAESIQAYFHNIHWGKFALNALLLSKAPALPPVFLNLPLKDVVNISMWSIRVEFECYLMVIVLGWLQFYRKPFLLVGLFGAVYVLHILQSAHFGVFADHFQEQERHIRPVTYFLAGMCFYLFRNKIPLTPAYLGGAIVASVLALWGGGGAIWPLAGTYILFYVAYDSRIKLQSFGKNGDFSYGMYLYAWPIQQLIVQYLGVTVSPLVVAAAASFLTLICAILSWKLVEGPALRLKPRSSLKQEPPLASTHDDAPNARQVA